MAMYEKFTDRARKVMALANQEAQRFKHEYIGTEHMLLGLVKDGSGVGANVLKSLDVDLRKVSLDARGAWDMTLHNGVEVRLGRRDVDSRTGLFLDIVADIITSRAAEINYVDMRYSNGFTIGWNNGSRTPVDDPDEKVEGMLALRGEG